MNQQLSSTLADLSVQLGSLRFPLDQLCGGLLVCGMTGSGKTVSVVNPLAQQFAALKSKQQARKPAIVYFSLKGRPHEQFLAGLPKERRADVVTISQESPVWVSLFNRANWRSEAELNGAVVRFVDEFSQHLSDEMTTQRHDVFWERQRLRYAKTLLGLQVKYSPLISLSPAIRDLNSEDGLKIRCPLKTCRFDPYRRYFSFLCKWPRITEKTLAGCNRTAKQWQRMATHKNGCLRPKKWRTSGARATAAATDRGRGILRFIPAGAPRLISYSLF